jgi:hypothetical protein
LFVACFVGLEIEVRELAKEGKKEESESESER